MCILISFSTRFIFIILCFFFWTEVFSSIACLHHFVGLIDFFFGENLFFTAIRIAEKLGANKHMIDKSPYNARRWRWHEDRRSRNSTSQWKRVWSLHRRHGRRVLVSVKVRYGFLLGVWWPDLCTTVSALRTVVKILSRKIPDPGIISYKDLFHFQVSFLLFLNDIFFICNLILTLNLILNFVYINYFIINFLPIPFFQRNKFYYNYY